MTLTPEGYVPRIADAQVAEALRVFGAVVIEGPKWCGKTWTALNQAASVFLLADPRGGFANRQEARVDPDRALDGPTPRVLDEWQEAPGLWDAVRFRVDQSNQRGLFVLTGSATPADGAVMHSGVGRLGRVRMRPMTLFEQGQSTGSASLHAIFSQAPIKTEKASLTWESLAQLCVKGGWPGTRDLSPIQSQMMATAYLDALAGADIAAINGGRTDPLRIQALLISLARNTATTVSNTTLAGDIAPYLPGPASAGAIRQYLSLLQRLFVLEEIPAWLPGVRSRARLRVAPKRLLCDPSLACAALGLSANGLAQDRKTMGLVFETLCLRDLAVYAQAAQASLWHYRDETGLEVDAILERRDGSWVGVEIKLGSDQTDAAAQALKRLDRKVQGDGNPPAKRLVVLTGVGGVSHQRPDGVTVIPIDQLAP